MKKNKKHMILGLTIAALSIGSLCSCGSKDTEEQLSFRKEGITCMQNGDYENAVKNFQKALDKSVGGITELEIDTCYYKAEALHLLGDDEGAVETYTAITEYNKDARAYYLRACLYLEQGKTKKGQADLKRAGKYAKEDYELYIAIYQAMKQYDMEAQGQQYLNTALAIKGDSTNDMLFKGQIYGLLGDTKSAVENLEKAMEKEPKANYYLAQVYAEDGQDTLAQTYFKAYLDNGTATSEELCAMGETLMGKGDYVTAIEYFRSAMAMENVDNMQRLMKNMVIAYERQGDYEAARLAIQEYVKAYPADDEAVKEEAFLSTR